MGLTLEQLALIAKAKAQSSIEPAKAKQSKQTRERAGYCKPLPIGPLTPKAGESRWALLAKGTVSTKARNCTKTDARPKASLGDRRIMRDIANMSLADALYELPESCPKHGRGLEDLQPIFTELLRLALVKRSDDFETDRSVKLSGKEYQNLRRALAKGQTDIVGKILERNMNLNQVR